MRGKIDLKKIYPCLCNEKTAWFDKETMGIEQCMDLWVTFHAVNETDDMFAILCKDDIKKMGLSYRQLLQIALINLNDAFKIVDRNESGWIQVSTKYDLFGSAYILSHEIMTMFANMFNSDVIILPSSMNDLILMSGKTEDSYSYLTNIVKGLNKQADNLNIYLSDHPYIYRIDKDMIETVF